MQTYFVNFIKTGDPNGDGLPRWYGLQSSIPKVMMFNSNSQSQPEKNLKRYVMLDSFYSK
jgi:para-nitrobenzyl esterase